MRTLLCLIVLSGCARGNAMIACQHEAGPAPYPAAGLFGVIGGLVANAQPDMIAYNTKIDRCVASRGF